MVVVTMMMVVMMMVVVIMMVVMMVVVIVVSDCVGNICHIPMTLSQRRPKPRLTNKKKKRIHSSILLSQFELKRESNSYRIKSNFYYI